VSRFESYLDSRGLWSEIDRESIREEANGRFDRAKKEADAYDPGGVEEMFSPLYEELPPELERQREAFETFWRSVRTPTTTSSTGRRAN
jgi:pyruvate dehydrogenase E1 component alpha subunit